MGDSTDDAADTRERMMVATLHVLQDHGYAGLSIQRIADEADLSKSSIYHFYDGKDDLLLSFLEFMLERFRLPPEDAFGDDALADLRAHLEFALVGASADVPTPVEGFDPGSGEPYVELRSQAAHDDDYRERFTHIDASLRERLAGIVERGIEDGDFRHVDPDQTAELLVTVMLGALFRRATADGFDVDAVRDELETVLSAHLLVAESD